MICGLECKFYVYCTDTEDYLEETGPRGTAAFISSVPVSLLMVLAILKEKNEVTVVFVQRKENVYWIYSINPWPQYLIARADK